MVIYTRTDTLYSSNVEDADSSSYSCDNGDKCDLGGEACTDGSDCIFKEDAYIRAKRFEKKLKDSEFIKYFKTDEQGEPNFAAVKYENEEDGKLYKIVFEGELKQTLERKSRIRRKNKEKKDK